ncbi:DUF6246 family protein [Yersinia rochesterensis]|uniref:DUF6246 family protein n=1 Tax=Yersinia rochesterensis TaxID=1604335 RepID=UPI0028530601|nr:DUF6246 family protein [Yersinia rochesterensis]MDR5020007.1 DUF6246 family protein [Yersinia rochesterensis]
MTPLKEIGEALISDDKRDYFFRPSFVSMSRIGSPKGIVEHFAELHSNEVADVLGRAIDAYGVIPEWLSRIVLAPEFSKKTISAAMCVMQVCCDDDISPLIGELRPSKRGKKAFTYLPGSMPLSDIVVIAQSLITHGIIGKAKVRKLQRHESNSYVNEFSAFEYISAARNHFNMPRAEAEQLSMTEFQLLLNAKYPDQKGFTKEEYDSIADDYFAKKQAKLAKTA